jgi:ubiquinone/menaquinone biosynthesis C-methylase UbiE
LEAALAAGMIVLDVGCGTGVPTLALAERGCKAVGSDASAPYLEGARRRRSHPAVTYELGDARRMHYSDASFDACVSTLAIDVIPEFDQVAADLACRDRGLPHADFGKLISPCCKFGDGVATTVGP